MSRVLALDTLPSGDPEQLAALVGGKAANLGAMIRDLGLPVPPGFVITTTTCREFLADGWPAGLDAEIRDAMGVLEGKLGHRFGDPGDPLLVSVRSGAPVSMPGMMDTILNIGLAHGTIAWGDAAFTAACRERLQSMFRTTVGADVPDDPWHQLRLAIEAVFRSWNADRARAYRDKEGISDDLGTAVTVQAMVFGNLGEDSATGVVFTRNPSTGERGLYGDVLFDAQGEDVVAGTHATQPIAILDERLPEAAVALREAADRLERHYRDLCDIEFTIERGRLWMLQVRVGKRSPQAALRIAVEMAEDPSFPLSRQEAVERVRDLLVDPPTRTTGRSGYLLPLVTGLGASPGVATGEIATTPDAAVRGAEAGRSVVLVRPETSPDDVHGMAQSVGVLTARGGLASHAAVVARGWGIPAVVGATAVEVSAAAVVVGGRPFAEGDVITIDGSTGEVFEGAVPGTVEVVPEARTLLGWAKEQGIAITEAERPRAAGVDGRPTRRASLDDCLRTLSTKGFATTPMLAEALGSSPDQVQSLLDQLVVDGLASTVAGAYRLTDAGKTRASELLAVDRTEWGSDQAVAALDGFLALDQRMKDTVTAWQLRPAEGGGEAAVNDHSDPDYDRAVLERLVGLHEDAVAWLAPLETACRRLAGYRERLSRAIDKAVGGDQRYVASPRVDSYHGIWFELHEDLIQLAGRTREEETAAGRA